MTAGKDTTEADQVQVYNLDHTTTPGGMKVRWRVRVATGKEAERLEKQQNQAIIRLLAWADQYIREHEQNTQPSQENGGNVSRETTRNVTVMSPGRNRIRNDAPAAEKGHAA
jgi:hypothetical protein